MDSSVCYSRSPMVDADDDDDDVGVRFIAHSTESRFCESMHEATANCKASFAIA